MGILVLAFTQANAERMLEKCIRLEITDIDKDTTMMEINLPWSLAQYADKLVPEDTRKKMEEDGIDVKKLIKDAIDEIDKISEETNKLLEIELDGSKVELVLVPLEEVIEPAKGKPKWFIMRVIEEDGEKTRIKFPIILAEVALKILPYFELEEEDEQAVHFLAKFVAEIRNTKGIYRFMHVENGDRVDIYFK
ncbi:MAG TPA: hypothetical protein EYP60_07645 [bacterium (Candidatus Stahlbacteria)]|nr:hypothetical protein [Candidatus Stahlbacteria bacterium]